MIPKMVNCTSGVHNLKLKGNILRSCITLWCQMIHRPHLVFVSEEGNILGRIVWNLVMAGDNLKAVILFVCAMCEEENIIINIPSRIMLTWYSERSYCRVVSKKIFKEVGTLVRCLFHNQIGLLEFFFFFIMAVIFHFTFTILIYPWPVKAGHIFTNQLQIKTKTKK